MFFIPPIENLAISLGPWPATLAVPQACPSPSSASQASLLGHSAPERLSRPGHYSHDCKISQRRPSRGTQTQLCLLLVSDQQHISQAVAFWLLKHRCRPSLSTDRSWALREALRSLWIFTELVLPAAGLRNHKQLDLSKKRHLELPYFPTSHYHPSFRTSTPTVAYVSDLLTAYKTFILIP